MWKHGTLEIKGQAIDYDAKVYDEPSYFGINRGKISKLTLKHNGEYIANYDRDWDIVPADKLAEDALEMVLDMFN